tara:strand:- start:807 stop:1424 length:618 start_codon:yes stop_codon:yes gene_type:complete
MANFLEDFVMEHSEYAQDVDSVVREFQDDLAEYMHEMGLSVWEKEGMSLEDLQKPPLDFDFYDFPSPLNPLQYPNPEIVDAMRHYYGPMLVSDEFNTLTGYGTAIYNELGEVETTNLREQTAYDLWNNLISLIDYYKKPEGFGKEAAYKLINKDLTTGERMPGLVDPQTFEELAKIALDRVAVPPVYEDSPGLYDMNQNQDIPGY